MTSLVQSDLQQPWVERESDDEFALWLARLNRDEVLASYQRQTIAPVRRTRIRPVNMSLERAYQIADEAAERGSK